MLVVFDMDGTLIDTQGLICEHMDSAFLGAGLDAPGPAAVRRVIGLSLPLAMGELSGSADAALIERLTEDYKALYRAGLAEAGAREPLYPGARAAIERITARPGARLGIATGKGLAGAERILALHGLSAHFSTVQTPDHNPSKPHPGMLLRAMEETGAEPGETVMIGDTVYDIELGRAAGVRTIGVGWGYHEPEELLAAGADSLIERFEDLDSAIGQVLE